MASTETSVAAWNAWRSEQNRSFFVAVGGATLAFIVFALVDKSLSSDPERLTEALTARIIMVGVCLLEALVFGFLKRFPFRTEVVFLTACFGASWITAILTNGPNGYHDSVMLAMFVYSAGVPTTVRIALTVYAIAFLVHVGCLYALHDAATVTAGANQVGLLLMSMGLATAVVWIISGHRKQHFEDIENLKAVDAAKDSFFANVNHELRTPLAIVIDYLQGLGENFQRTKSVPQNYIVARRNAERLAAMINDLLQLTRLDAKGATLTLSRWSMSSLIRECIEDLGPLAGRNGVSLAFDRSDEDVVVTADYHAIERVVVNLLTNAMKFTDRGGTITVRLTKTDRALQVDVTDTGKGIPPNEVEHVFTRLYQGESGKRVRQSGVGIGLSMCKKIMAMHSGDVFIASTKVGEGTTMRFKMPLGSADAPGGKGAKALLWTDASSTATYRLAAFAEASERRAVPRAGGNKRGPPVLIVEDNRDLADRLVVLLGDEYDLSVAENGADGLRSARQYQPALIISDINMPVMTGMEMLAQIKQDAALKDIPVIIMTAGHTPEGKEMSHAYDADEYIDKAKFRTELPLAVKKHIRKRQTIIDQATAQAQLATQIVINGLIHDIGNPVFYMSNAIDLIDQEATPVIVNAAPLNLITEEGVGDYKRNVSSVKEGLTNMKDLLNQLRVVASGKEETEAQVMPVTPLLQRALSVTSTTSKAIKRTYAAKHPVALRRGPFVSVIINLITNARQAGGPDCKIEVRTFDDLVNKSVVIEVADAGPGMKPELLGKIFEPHFTTKETGSGLGLWMCRDIISRHQGKLSVASQEGQGTTFTIVLPFAQQAPAKSQASGPATVV